MAGYAPFKDPRNILMNAWFTLASVTAALVISILAFAFGASLWAQVALLCVLPVALGSAVGVVIGSALSLSKTGTQDGRPELSPNRPS